jgi:hypothetical protein
VRSFPGLLCRILAISYPRYQLRESSAELGPCEGTMLQWHYKRCVQGRFRGYARQHRWQRSERFPSIRAPMRNGNQQVCACAIRSQCHSIDSMSAESCAVGDLLVTDCLGIIRLKFQQFFSETRVTWLDGTSEQWSRTGCLPQSFTMVQACNPDKRGR